MLPAKTHSHPHHIADSTFNWLTFPQGMSRPLIYSSLSKEDRIEKEMTWEERKVLFVAQGEHCSKSFGIIQTWVTQRSRMYELTAATDIYILSFRMRAQKRCGTSVSIKDAFLTWLESGRSSWRESNLQSFSTSTTSSSCLDL